MRKLLIAAPAFVLGCLLTASLTTVAKAKNPAPGKVYDYQVVSEPDDVRKFGLKGYEVVNVVRPNSLTYPIWTMQRK